jgi:uncharacterized protein (TIGR02246 family)
MKARWLVAGLVAVGLAGVAGLADDQRGAETKTRAGGTSSFNGNTGQTSSPDEAAIRDVVDRFTRAFNAGDARAIARLHTPDARVIDLAGEVAEGREAIEREYAGLFHDNPGAAIEIKVDELRLLGPEAAIEEGTTRIIPKDGAPAIVNRYSAVDVKRDGQWLLASVRESRSELTTHDRLRELEWMLGDWVDESGDSVIQSTCRWTADKQALLREFTIRSLGKVVMAGTQRIGWDPRAHQIKSWEFDSEGGNGEGLWARLGNQWVVKATAVLQDGRTATATHIITPQDASTCRWRTSERTVGSEVIPVVDDFVMVRPAPGTKVK